MQVLCGLQGLFLLFNCQTSDSDIFDLSVRIQIHKSLHTVILITFSIDAPIRFVKQNQYKIPTKIFSENQV